MIFSYSFARIPNPLGFFVSKSEKEIICPLWRFLFTASDFSKIDFRVSNSELSLLSIGFFKALKNPIDKRDNSEFDTLKSIFEKSLAVNKNLHKGHIISFSDLETKKPKGFGILANEYENIIGKKLTSSLNKFDFLNYSDFK